MDTETQLELPLDAQPPEVQLELPLDAQPPPPPPGVGLFEGLLEALANNKA